MDRFCALDGMLDIGVCIAKIIGRGYYCTTCKTNLQLQKKKKSVAGLLLSSLIANSAILDSRNRPSNPCSNHVQFPVTTTGSSIYCTHSLNPEQVPLHTPCCWHFDAFRPGRCKTILALGRGSSSLVPCDNWPKTYSGPSHPTPAPYQHIPLETALTKGTLSLSPARDTTWRPCLI